MFRLLFPLLLIFLFFTSCSKSRINDEEKFARAYVDLLIVQEKYANDTVKMKSNQGNIFRKYNITADQYQSTIEHYNQNPEKWESFFGKADKYFSSTRGKNKSSAPVSRNSNPDKRISNMRGKPAL